MRFRMFPAATCLLFLACPAVPAAAQTNALPRPIQKLIEDLKASEKSSATSPSDTSSFDRAREALGWWQENGQLKSFATEGGKECAHILVYKAPDVDSGMLQEVPKEFSSNMPRLQRAPQNCCGDIRSGMVAQRAKPYDPHGKFLPVPGEPEYKLLP